LTSGLRADPEHRAVGVAVGELVAAPGRVDGSHEALDARGRPLGVDGGGVVDEEVDGGARAVGRLAQVQLDAVARREPVARVTGATRSNTRRV
jgi:hypothetical protein